MSIKELKKGMYLPTLEDLLEDYIKEQRPQNFRKLTKGPKTFYIKIYRHKKGFNVNIVKKPKLKKGKATKVIKIVLKKKK